ncbi:MAG: ribokinase [Rhizobiales bacterium]|nr:ribokinase [Hyphomicrobiales bacterium]
MGRVLVAGSINMDVVVKAGRHPRIGETVAGHEVLFLPGGKGANQAIAASKLGAPTTLIGCLGRDAFGRDLRAFLAATDLDLDFLRDTADAPTGTAIITVADGDNTIVVIPGANASVNAADVAAPPLAADDIAVCQFETPLPAVTAFLERARTVGATTILNPAPALPCDRRLLGLADVLILNETELGFFAKREIGPTSDPATILEAARSLQTDSRQTICVTLGPRGFLALIGGEPHGEPGRPVTAVDTTGAGDCFVGAVAARLARRHTVRDALHYANVAASLCVQRVGAAPAMPSAAEVAAQVEG